MVRIAHSSGGKRTHPGIHVKKLRVLLADDHALMRAGIRSLLEKMPDVEVVGEAGDGLQALAMIEAHQPDVLLSDIAMHGQTGLEAAAKIKIQFPAVKVIILSMHANEEYVMQALKAGAVGYLLKESTAVELDLALDAVRRGETYLSPAINRKVIDGYLARTTGPGTSAPDALTPRQQQVLKLVAEGKSTKQIAAALKLSTKTVESHRAQLMQRLGIHDVAGLVKYALRAGIIAPTD